MTITAQRTTTHTPRLRTTLTRVAIVALAAASLTLGACGTTEGFGKDVKHLGGGIENSAAKNK